MGVAGSRPSFARLAHRGRSPLASPVSCSNIREPLRGVARRGFSLATTARCLVPRGCRLVPPDWLRLAPKSRKLRSVSSSRSACAYTRRVSSGFAWPSCDATQRTLLPEARARLANVCLASWSRSGRTPSFWPLRRTRCQVRVRFRPSRNPPISEQNTHSGISAQPCFRRDFFSSTELIGTSSSSATLSFARMPLGRRPANCEGSQNSDEDT